MIELLMNVWNWLPTASIVAGCLCFLLPSIKPGTINKGIAYSLSALIIAAGIYGNTHTFVPDITGIDIATARQILLSKELSSDILLTDNTKADPSQIIIWQYPAPDSIVRKDSILKATVEKTSQIIPDNQEQQVGITKVSRENRDWNHYFKNTKTYYNVFTSGEVENAFKVEMEYSSTRRDSGDSSCTGTREVYARNKRGEEYGNDSQWIKVGEFEYNHEGQVISVVIDWSDTRGPLDVYSMAIVRKNGSSDESFHNDWGEVVRIYSYIYPIL